MRIAANCQLRKNVDQRMGHHAYPQAVRLNIQSRENKAICQLTRQKPKDLYLWQGSFNIKIREMPNSPCSKGKDRGGETIAAFL